MENFIKTDLKVTDNYLNTLLSELNDLFESYTNNFAKICFSVNKILHYCDDHSYKTEKENKFYGYLSAKDLLMSFGLSARTVERLNRCYERFCASDLMGEVVILHEYRLFSPSKLFELLPLSITITNTCLEKQIIKPTMTVKEIRQKVKELAGKTDPDDLVAEDLDKIEEKTLDEQEAELPEAFDPKKTHTYEYFKAMSKEALITCLFQCEDYIKKLTTKKAGK